MSVSGVRKQKSDIPNIPCVCPHALCPYVSNSTGQLVCDTPRTNNGNGDAFCHTLTNKSVIRMLKRTGASHDRT